MRFNCFGTHCGVWGAGAADARGQLEAWHVQFSRFRADSELSRLNADPRREVPVSATMARLLDAVEVASRATGGLVDGTLVREIEAAGYRGDLGAPLPLRDALAARAAAAACRAAPRPDISVLRVPRLDGGVAARPGCRAPPAGPRDRQRRARQGPVRRPDRRADARQLRRRLRRRPALRRRAAPARGHRSVRRLAAARLRGPRRRGRDERDRPPVLARRATGAPPTTCSIPPTGRPAFTGVVQATALAPDRARGGVAGQGRGAERRPGVARPRRRARA